MPIAATFFRPARRVGTRRTVPGALLAVAALALAWPHGVTAADPGMARVAPEEASIQYQEALAHAGDQVDFMPGDAVTIPYTPRPGTSSIVGGSFAVPLPAGSATGRSMAASSQGSVWAEGEALPPADGSDFQISPALKDSTIEELVVSPAATANVLRREVYGFLPYWRLGDYINYDVMSTVAYFGVDLYTDGNLHKKDGSVSTRGWAGWTSSSMTTVINAAHANHVRVALTIESFAWDTVGANAQREFLANPTARNTAAVQIAAAIRDRGADGVNLDFEPIASGASDNYVSFVHELRTELDKIHPGYELTFCTTGRATTYDAAGLIGAGADSLWIMGYDFRSASTSYAASMDPLTSPRVYDLSDAVNAYKSLVPVSKIILGLPYYGRAYSTTTNTAYSPTQDYRVYGQPAAVPYYTAIALAESNGLNYDEVENSAWTAYYGTFGGSPTWRELYFDDVRALAARYDRVNYWNLRGVGIWTLGYDRGRPELNQLLADKFLTDKNPPKAGISNMAPKQDSEDFTVGWTARDDWNGIASYDLQVSTDGGPWADWLTGVTATSSSFPGRSGHNYSFRVRATDGVGNVGPWDVTTTYTPAPTLSLNGYGVVVAGSVNERGTPTTSAGVIRTAPSGTVFQIIGGPVSADGYTWYQVDGPITEQSPVTPTFPGPWIAASSETVVNMAPITPPNTTTVVAGIGHYTLGTPGSPPSLTGMDAGRTFSPNADGIRDTLGVSWDNQYAYTDVTLTIYELDGSPVGTIDLGPQGTGPQTYSWNGTSDGSTKLPDGQYMLQLAGTVGARTYYAPSAGPFDGAAWLAFGAVIDTTPSGTYFPLTPIRVLDTRVGTGLASAFSAGATRKLVVAGRNGVPVGAIAVTGNVTVTQASTKGFLRLGSTTATDCSTVNFGVKDDRANGITMGLANDGSLSMLYKSATGSGSVGVILDLTGYFMRSPTGATFVPLSAGRIVDTRTGTGIARYLTANQVASFTVAGKAGVPANATAVVGNATVAYPSGAGYVTVAPAIGAGVPTTSSLNFPAKDVRANNVTVPLSGGNLQVIYRAPAGHKVDFIFDVTGYFIPGLSGATFVPVTPMRVVDSRVNQGFAGPLVVKHSGTFSVHGQASVKMTAIAVAGNLTVTGQTAGGWLAVMPNASTSASTSTLNFPRTEVRANGFVGPLGPHGKLSVVYGGSTGAYSLQAIVDIYGYYR
jgi:spore germination protein YaaH